MSVAPAGLAGAGVVDVLARRRTGRVPAADWVAACLERIAERDAGLRAWVRVDAPAALEAARALDAEPRPRPLAGMPLGVKDVIDVAGLPTGCNSPTREGHVAGAHAASVARLVAAGAVVLGKTVTPEFAFVEPGPTRNPHDPARTPGGSSSGSAAAVADHHVPVALATQTGGSTIRPAAYCGIVGYKPPFGRVPTEGLVYLAPSLDVIGLHARSVADAAIVAEVLEGRPRPAAPTAAPRFVAVALPGLRACDAGALAAFRRGLRALADAGATVRHAELPDEVERLDDAHRTVMSVEVARSFEALAAADGARLSASLAAFVARGRATSGDALAAAQAVVARVRQALHAFAAEGEVLLTPAATGEAPVGLHATGDSVLNRPFSLLHVGAATVPAGTGPAGLPLGLQLADPHPAADRLFGAAAFAEAVLSGTAPASQERAP
jgi:Asp-tRNA(Asn)/Glu-tRNA(Gln) amidotransferase A subunit family amidase